MLGLDYGYIHCLPREFATLPQKEKAILIAAIDHKSDSLKRQKAEQDARAAAIKNKR